MTPTPIDVKAVREALQASKMIGITAAQDWCAAFLQLRSIDY